MSSDETFLRQLAEALAATRLDALVVGSVAGLLQGAPITTQDVDLLVRDTPLNRKKIEALAKALDASAPFLVSPLSTALRITGAAIDVDVLFDVLPPRLRFSSLKARAERVQLGKQKLSVASLADIIRSKQSVARAKDLAQLPILKQTLEVSALKRR